MLLVRVFGVVFCPVLLCYFCTLGISRFVEAEIVAGLDRRVLTILSMLAAATLVAAMFLGVVAELRVREKLKSSV
jgi:hypothetical protein